MNQREKILVYVVGGLLGAVCLQYSLSSYQSGLRIRKTKVYNAEDKLLNDQEQEFAGTQADMQLAKYQRRSLPSDPEAAQAQYKAWLESVVQKSGLLNQSIDYVGDQGSNKLFRIYAFRISGSGDIKKISGFLAEFHKKNYLQRAKKFTLHPTKGGSLLMNIDVEAIAMTSAARDQSQPAVKDPRIVGRQESLIDAVINRNMFSPANRAPRYSGDKTITASIETDFRSRLRFDDPDSGNKVQYEVVGALPEGIQFKGGELVGRPMAKGEFEIFVRAWDDGLPTREIKETLVLKVGDPPPPPVKPDEPVPFDESQQAILTGLVQSQGQWKAWIYIRTQNKMLKLKVGDDFKVGTVEGTIVDVTDRFAVFESEGERYTMQHDSSLADTKHAN